MKCDVPVRHFERRTGWCPAYLAGQVLDEARDYLRAGIPEGYTAAMARRAEAVFKKHPLWRRRFQSPQGRAYLVSLMRHWLAGRLARENPALFRRLPDGFKVGQPLPAGLKDEQILERLRALNPERAAGETKPAKVKKPKTTRAKSEDEMI